MNAAGAVCVEKGEARGSTMSFSFVVDAFCSWRQTKMKEFLMSSVLAHLEKESGMNGVVPTKEKT
jgi:hypothetical protein